jgi:hypothetical protein
MVKMPARELIVCLLLVLAADVRGLENPSFEASEPLQSWRSAIIKEGREPVIRVDRSQRRTGKQSLLIAAKDPADIAISQNVRLRADSLWRATCWIRTENLKAVGETEIGGTLHIRTVHNHLVAEAPGRQFGTSPWRQLEVTFRVPQSGQVLIVLFFVGFGKGTGRVWFDDVRLEEITPESRTEIGRSIENSNGRIALEDTNRISIGLMEQIQLTCYAGMVVLADGTRLGPLDLSKARVLIKQDKDRCGAIDQLSISGLVDKGMRVNMVWSLYRDKPVVALDMSVVNETSEEIFLYRLVPLWGEPPVMGFSGSFPKWPGCRFLQQPDYWSRSAGPRPIPADSSVPAFWSTVIGSTGETSLAIGIGETARGGSRMDFTAREGRVGVKLSTWLQTDLKGRKLRLPPGTSYVCHRMLLAAGANPNDALDRYTDFVCKFMNWHLRHPPYTGLFTAYGNDPSNRDPVRHKLSEKRLAELMRVVDKYLKPYGLGTTKTQFCGLSSSRPNGGPVTKLTAEEAKKTGLVRKLVREIREKGFAPDYYDSRKDFPHGLGWHVKQLAKEGFRPALVCRPFYNIKAATPELDRAAALLFEMAVKDWGYRYLMFDFISVDYDSDNDTITVAQGIANRFRAVRERLGREIFIEACMVWPGPVLGLADGYRPAEDWRGGLEEVLAPVFASRYHYHGRVFQCDNEFFDPASRPFTWGRRAVEHMVSSEDRLRLWVSYNAILGYSYLCGGALERVEPERWWIFQRGMPAQQGRAEPLDLLENSPPKRWIRQCTTPSGTSYVLALFNWDKTSPSDLPVEPKHWGLGDNTDYLFFDFWAGQVYGPARILPNRVAPFSCRILQVHPVPDKPALVGNSRHVTGQVGIEQWQWIPQKAMVKGVFSGAPSSREHYWIWLPGNERVTKCSGAGVEPVRPHVIRLDVHFDKSGRQDWKLRLDKTVPAR